MGPAARLATAETAGSTRAGRPVLDQRVETTVAIYLRIDTHDEPVSAGADSAGAAREPAVRVAILGQELGEEVVLTC